MTSLTFNDISEFAVPSGSLAYWWLGQAGFILKSPSGKVIVLDPYLSDACEADGIRLGLNAKRNFPPPISARELSRVDLYVITHTHLDHLDPYTLEPYRNAGGKGPYLAPPEACERLKSLGIPSDQINMIWPNKTYEIGDIKLRATFAIGFGGDDLTHVGYLISVTDGPTFYFTGDTAYEDLLWLSVREHHPDVMITVINGAFRNLSPAEAANVAFRIDPKVVIPCHHDLFPCNSVSGEMLQTNLILLGIGQKFKAIDQGQPYCYAKSLNR